MLLDVKRIDASLALGFACGLAELRQPPLDVPLHLLGPLVFGDRGVHLLQRGDLLGHRLGGTEGLLGVQVLRRQVCGHGTLTRFTLLLCGPILPHARAFASGVKTLQRCGAFGTMHADAVRARGPAASAAGSKRND